MERLQCIHYSDCNVRKVLPLVCECGKCPKFKDYEEML